MKNPIGRSYCIYYLYTLYTISNNRNASEMLKPSTQGLEHIFSLRKA